MNDMYINFHKYFEIVIADTEELLKKAYRLRYQVLCVEQRIPGFDALLYPDKLEKDNYDSHSSHVLLRHRPSGDFVGTVRLIMFDPLQPEKLLPVELNTQLDSEFNIKALPRQKIAEISRTLIVKQFDRRKQDRFVHEAGEVDENTPARDRQSSERRSTPHLSLMLTAGVVRMSTIYNIRHWLSMMDPALNRMLGFYGLNFNPVGPLVDYHGIRRPYYLKVEDALNRMRKEHHDAWEVATECGEYHSFLPANRKVLNQEFIF
jgi:N-acyl amino acid synthase of PEP-CTERM/exosortase system